MLPILRILPVGGVLLAILILVLALSPPDGSRSPLTMTIAPARGALLDRERHPEVRQFLIQAALKRADELNRLRELSDTPRAKGAPGAAKIAGLPGARKDAGVDETGSINENPTISIPIEIGERSSTELPVQEESETAVKTPEPAKTRRRAVHRTRRTKVTAPAPQPFLFDFWFSGEQAQTLPANQIRQTYGASQSGGKQTNQSAASYTSPVPQTNPY